MPTKRERGRERSSTSRKVNKDKVERNEKAQYSYAHTQQLDLTIYIVLGVRKHWCVL